MAKELYNLDQVRVYALIAMNNLLKKKDKNKVNLQEFKRELDSLQTSLGKEGIIGYANKLLKNDLKINESAYF